MNADHLLRLYPRPWRARYEDEMRALLSETTITPAVVIDLLRGACREWAREVTSPIGEPVDLKFERRRDRRRWMTCFVAMITVSWTLAQTLLWAGVSANSYYAMPFFCAPFVALFWTMRGSYRRGRLAYRNILGYEKVPAEALKDPGISSRLFWTGVVLSVVSFTAYWMIPGSPESSSGLPPQLLAVMRWYVILLMARLPLDFLSRTKPELRRREMINQLALLDAQKR